MTGYPVMTFSRGRLVYEEGSFWESPDGAVVKCFRSRIKEKDRTFLFSEHYCRVLVIEE